MDRVLKTDEITPNVHTEEDIDKLINANNGDSTLIINKLISLAGHSIYDKGTTLLHRLASYSNKSHLIEHLVKKYNVDLNAVTHEQHFTPLTMAAYYRNVDNVRRLLKLGAEPNLTNPFKECFRWTEFAESREGIDKIIEICSLLLNYGSTGIIDEKYRKHPEIRYYNFEESYVWSSVRFKRLIIDHNDDFYEETLERFRNIFSDGINVKPAKIK